MKPTPKPTPKPPPVVKPVPSPPSPGRPMRTAGWVLVGVGGASLIAGLVLGGWAADVAGTLEDQNANEDTEYEDVIEDEDLGRSLQKGQVLTLIVGGAVVATGALLLILDSRKNRERRAWLAPTVTSTGAFVSGGFSF